MQNLVRGQLAGEKLFHDTVEDAYGVLAQVGGSTHPRPITSSATKHCVQV